MTLARIMHKFFTVAPKPSALTALPLARAPRRAVQHACGALGRAWRNALRTAFSTPRYKNLCITRACLLTCNRRFGGLPKRIEMSNMDPVKSRRLEAESRDYVGKEDSQPLKAYAQSNAP